MYSVKRRVFERTTDSSSFTNCPLFFGIGLVLMYDDDDGIGKP